MLYKFPSLHDDALSSMEKELTDHTFVPHQKLKNFVSQLKKIDRSLDSALMEDTSHQSSLEEQKDIVSRLAGRCHQLKVRNDVIGLAEEAEEIANSSPEKSDAEIEEKVANLQKRIDAFVQSHRPSHNNAKFIRFAKALLDKAIKHQPVIIPKAKTSNIVTLDQHRTKDVTLKSYELAEALYELAHLLYTEECDEFNKSLKKNFSQETQKEIKFHASICEGDLSKIADESDRIKIVQGILGFAHEITDYYLNNTPYPSAEEVHLTFKDLEDVNHIEDEDL